MKREKILMSDLVKTGRFSNLHFKPGFHAGEVDFIGVKSKTDQSFKDSCDVNNILANYRKAGVNPFVITGEGGDFSSLPSFQEAQNLLIRAETQFMSLDAKLRKRFDNDPAQFLAFVNDPQNGDELYTLGLRKKANGDVLNSSDKVSSSPVEKAPPSAGQADKSTK